LVAVSGGADSVALLRALHAISDCRDFLHAAHFNHQWRGAESDLDEHFVRQLCNELNVSLAVGTPCDLHVDSLTLNHVSKTEEFARQMRYRFLSKTAYQIGARYVVTAHTASDRVETMLHNLCRGTGLAGVVTPTAKSELDSELMLIRPLLNCHRNDLLQYLAETGTSFREDSSNRNQDYTRNFIRHSVLPLLRSRFGEQLDRHWCDFAEIANDARQALLFYAHRWLDESKERIATFRQASGDPVSSLVFARADFSEAPWPVIQMALEMEWKRRSWPLKDMTRWHWSQLRELVLSPTEMKELWVAKLNLPGDLRLSLRSNWAKIEILKKNG
jgi:tRNA(Ile)-lysidine synthase